MQSVGGAALAQSVATADAAPAPRKWPIEEGPDTPKICLAPGDGGGPLPANMQPAAPAAAGAPGAAGGSGPRRKRRRWWRLRRISGAQTEAAMAPPADAAGRGGRGGFGNPAAGYQRIRQLGVTHLLGVGIGGTPWTEENVRNAVQTAKDAGLVAYNSMINLPSSVIYGKETRAKDMEPFIASMEAAGKGGLTVVEYNFYAHRAVEGYYETVGRAKAGYTGFDYELELLINEKGAVVQPIYRDENGQITSETLAAFPNAKKVKFKDLPPLANEGAHNLQEMWANATYFLKAAVPAAEKAGVRLALHPNDPPAPISRGSQQIMGTLAGWKHLIEIVNSPANGITFDCGVTRELGEDPVVVAEYFASRKRINHVHYRNVQVVKPYEKYQEVFIDAGHGRYVRRDESAGEEQVHRDDLSRASARVGCDRDRVGPGGRIGGYPGGGGYTGIAYSVAYTRAMMQAALESV